MYDTITEFNCDCILGVCSICSRPHWFCLLCSERRHCSTWLLHIKLLLLSVGNRLQIYFVSMWFIPYIWWENWHKPCLGNKMETFHWSIYCRHVTLVHCVLIICELCGGEYAHSGQWLDCRKMKEVAWYSVGAEIVHITQSVQAGSWAPFSLLSSGFWRCKLTV
jgi:hypothetical protein